MNIYSDIKMLLEKYSNDIQITEWNDERQTLNLLSKNIHKNKYEMLGEFDKEEVLKYIKNNETEAYRALRKIYPEEFI